jgi:hypothetical protein
MKNMKKVFPAILLLCIWTGSAVIAQSPVAGKKKYEVAVYYFPDFHVDANNEHWHGKSWTEWEVVKAAKPRFAGHQQPKVPSWGYFDESDPKWAAKEIDLASSHGIDVFIYDWYWYAKTGRYLQDGLEKGFLKAPNRNKIKFALMWANHDWLNIHPATYDNTRVKLTEGKVSMQLWDKISTYIVEQYFKQPNYWKIDGKPYFSIYEIITFINGLGGMDNAKKAITLLDQKTKKAGFPGVHFNIMSNMVSDTLVNKITGPGAPVNARAMLDKLDCNSVSTYCVAHTFDMKKNGFPTIDYEKAFTSEKKYWKDFIDKYPGILYTPNVSMGWDASPRCMQSDKFEMRQYPWTPVLTGNTPAVFEKALRDAKQFLDRYNPKQKILVINSWNEWTEGSYLLPEKRTGTGYLDAIKTVFGK